MPAFPVPMGGADLAIRFQEVQYFRQPWFLTSTLGISALAWIAFVSQILLGVPFGNNPGPDDLVWFTLVMFGIIFPAFLLSIHLSVEVRSDAIWLRFFPIHLRYHQIPRSSIMSHEVITYRPLNDYGGWGIKWGERGKVYNVSGVSGVTLHLRGGEDVTIGSQRSEELDMVLRSI